MNRSDVEAGKFPEHEDELRENSDELQFALQTGVFGVWRLELPSNRLLTSRTCRTIFGRDPDQPFSYDELRAAIHLDDQPRMAAAVRHTIETGVDYDIEYRVIAPDGDQRWVNVRGRLTRNENDTPARIAGISTEITKRRRAEANRLALVELSDCIRDIDNTADLAFAAAEILGRTLDVGRAGYGTIDPVAETITIERDWNAPGIKSLAGVLNFRDYGSYISDLKRGDTVIVEDATKDIRTSATAHQLLAISAQAFVNMPITERGDAVALLYLNHKAAREWPAEELALIREVADRTRTAIERNRVESELRGLAASLERQVEQRTAERDRAWKNSRDLQLVLDMDGIIRAANEAWIGILGWRTDEVVGRHHLEFNHPEHRTLSTEAFDQSAKAELSAYETRCVHKDGGFRWISWVAAPQGGAIYASGRNVTAERAAAAELEQIQEQLRQSQKLEAVGQLTGGVAHDFNNLLTVIRSAADLLARPNLPEERRQRYISAISETVDRAAKLTAQLLAFARRQALKPEVFDIALELRNPKGMLDSLLGSRIRIKLDMPDQTCSINADLNQFNTALVNVAVNARDAMDGEGDLGIVVNPVSRIPAVRTHAAVSGEFVAVCITDSGAGIPPEHLMQIFEPFFTTKAVGQGTGLGLSQVFGFAKQSGGEVRVESEIGKGTTFILYLPRVDAEIRAPEIEPKALVDGHGTRVLVVEDNVDVGRFATQTLAELGYQTEWASNAKEALAELARNNGHFDVVFSDVVMPGMNGVDLAKEIRRRHAGLPVVLTSGYSHVLAQHGAEGFELLLKPYSVEQLSRILRATLARPSVGGVQARPGD